jgi:hypothetical protein
MSEAEGDADGRPTAGPLASDEIGVHIVCRDCPWEMLVVPHEELGGVETRADGYAAGHRAATDHETASAEVSG